MSETKVCSNAECLTPYVPNVRGAVKDFCPRCYAYGRRHPGQLPGPKREAVPTTRHTVVLPEDFAERVAKVSNLPVATWVRLVAERALRDYEGIRHGG